MSNKLVKIDTPELLSPSDMAKELTQREIKAIEDPDIKIEYSKFSIPLAALLLLFRVNKLFAISFSILTPMLLLVRILCPSLFAICDVIDGFEYLNIFWPMFGPFLGATALSVGVHFGLKRIVIPRAKQRLLPQIRKRLEETGEYYIMLAGVIDERYKLEEKSLSEKVAAHNLRKQEILSQLRSLAKVKTSTASKAKTKALLDLELAEINKQLRQLALMKKALQKSKNHRLEECKRGGVTSVALAKHKPPVSIDDELEDIRTNMAVAQKRLEELAENQDARIKAITEDELGKVEALAELDEEKLLLEGNLPDYGKNK